MIGYSDCVGASQQFSVRRQRSANHASPDSMCFRLPMAKDFPQPWLRTSLPGISWRSRAGRWALGADQTFTWRTAYRNNTAERRENEREQGQGPVPLEWQRYLADP